ncbi:MAG: sulfatase [Thermoguttaceae bacterium]
MKNVLSSCLAALSIAVVATTQAADAARRPNVLFIAVDDLNTRIACYGDPVARTPHLDRLARSGIRFERAYCQFPLCNPSRASLLLGRYPTTTQIIDFSYPALLGRDWVTLPQHFRNNGYAVRLLGKVYHFDKDLMKSWFHEEVPGDEYPPDWTAGEKWVRKSQEIHARMLADLTRWEPYRSLSPPPSGWVKMLRTWANVFGSVPNAEEEGAAARARAYEWTADVKNAKQAIEQLTRWAAPEKPFFLGVGFYKPHVPLVAPKRFFDLYPAEKMPLPADFAPTPTADDSVPRCALRYNLDLFYEERPTPQRARAATAAYYACISFMDEQLGLLLDALERLGLCDNTVIVLWGDHGWHLGEKGMWAKGTLFDVSARAPLIIVDPRRKTAGRPCPRTVEFVDIYPTLAEICGLALPPGLEGKSLVPLLDNPKAAWDKPAYTLVAREDWLGRSVRTERWCYTEWDEGRRGAELYDLHADPRESKNLAGAPQWTAVVAELRTLLHTGPVAKPSPVGAAQH